MAKKFTYLWSIKIDGNFMNGIVYCGSKDDAFNRLENEVQIGYEKMCNKASKGEWGSVSPYIEKDHKLHYGTNAIVWLQPYHCADYPEVYITYKVSKVRVPV